VIISVVYLVVRCLVSCLTVLTRRQLSKDAELRVPGGEVPPGYPTSVRPARARTNGAPWPALAYVPAVPVDHSAEPDEP
jgi:hypothetical protein